MVQPSSTRSTHTLPNGHDPSTPWWEQLPDDFSSQANTTELDVSDWLQVQVTAAMERIARIPLASAVAASMGSSLLAPGRVQAEFEALRFYEPLARGGDVSRVFRAPPKSITVGASPASECMAVSSGIRRWALRFDSPFKPLNPAAAETFKGMSRNAVSHAEHWCHGDKPRPTLIVIHGFGAHKPWMNARMLALEERYREGYDILLFTFPHHGQRAETSSWFNGQGVFGNGLVHFNEVTLLAIHDLRVYLDHLRANGVEHIGVTGISQGGYVASLLARVDEHLAFCVPIVPAVSPVDAFLEWQPTGVLLTQLMRSQGVGVAGMRGLLAVHNPLSYAPRIDGERVLIIGGAGDRVSAPRHLRLLHQHWPRSSLHWFPGNHVMHLGRHAYLKRMRALMARWTAN